MARQQKIEDARREAVNSPTAWFCVLERAQRTHNYETAARAQQQLERLGVRVSFRTRAEDGPAAAGTGDRAR